MRTGSSTLDLRCLEAACPADPIAGRPAHLTEQLMADILLPDLRCAFADEVSLPRTGRRTSIARTLRTAGLAASGGFTSLAVHGFIELSAGIRRRSDQPGNLALVVVPPRARRLDQDPGLSARTTEGGKDNLREAVGTLALGL